MPWACRDAFAEVRDVVVVDDERPSQHGLEGAGEAALRTPREVILEVAALGPLRDSGDVIRIVLIAHDPYRLAAFVLEALAKDLYQQVGNIVPAAGLGKQFVGDEGAHRRVPLLFRIESTNALQEVARAAAGSGPGTLISWRGC